MIHREGGKKWKLPGRVRVVGNREWAPQVYTYRVLGFRQPRKGEMYLSGTTIGAWTAPNDLDTSFLVIEVLEELVPRTVWVPKEKES